MARKRWEQRIAEAEARGGKFGGTFTPSDKRLAQQWVTCACGEQDPRIPRMSGPKTRVFGGPGRPQDEQLHSLGGRFYSHVQLDDPTRARRVLQEIETRAAQLLYFPPELFEVVQELLNQQPQAHQDCLASAGIV